jgi:hypothetical protein
MKRRVRKPVNAPDPLERYAIVSRNYIAEAMFKPQTSEAKLEFGTQFGHDSQNAEIKPVSRRLTSG